MPEVVCERCGEARGAPGAPAGSLLGWSTTGEGDGRGHLCPACTREHIRAIEAKLPGEWW